MSRNHLGLRPAEQYRELGVELSLGERVYDLGLERHQVQLESGSAVDWDLLCITTGSDARRLPDLVEAMYLRELPQADALRSVIDRRMSIAIIGAGFIGCEVAAVAAQRGCQVRMYDVLEQPLQHVLGEHLGAFIASVHREHGVNLRLNVESPPTTDRPVLVGVGSAPRTELAESAGLEVDRGIVVDERGRTSVPHVFAAGDVTRFFSPLYETRIRVEHFQTAQRQGFAVGRAMAGANEPYSEVPWFWSDQYDLNVQYVGASLPWDETVTRGEFGKPPFAIFYLRGGSLVAAAGINDHHTVARARRLMERRRPVSVQQLADPRFDLRLAALA